MSGECGHRVASSPVSPPSVCLPSSCSAPNKICCLSRSSRLASRLLPQHESSMRNYWYTECYKRKRLGSSGKRKRNYARSQQARSTPCRTLIPSNRSASRAAFCPTAFPLASWQRVKRGRFPDPAPRPFLYPGFHARLSEALYPILQCFHFFVLNFDRECKYDPYHDRSTMSYDAASRLRPRPCSPLSTSPPFFSPAYPLSPGA